MLHNNKRHAPKLTLKLYQAYLLRRQIILSQKILNRFILKYEEVKAGFRIKT